MTAIAEEFLHFLTSTGKKNHTKNFTNVIIDKNFLFDGVSIGNIHLCVNRTFRAFRRALATRCGGVKMEDFYTTYLQYVTVRIYWNFMSHRCSADGEWAHGRWSAFNLPWLRSGSHRPKCFISQKHDLSSMAKRISTRRRDRGGRIEIR